MTASPETPRPAENIRAFGDAAANGLQYSDEIVGTTCQLNRRYVVFVKMQRQVTSRTTKTPASNLDRLAAVHSAPHLQK